MTSPSDKLKVELPGWYMNAVSPEDLRAGLKEVEAMLRMCVLDLHKRARLYSSVAIVEELADAIREVERSIE